MRLLLHTRHRRLLVLTGADVPDEDDGDVQAVVDNSGGCMEVAPPPFGFAMPDEDDE